MRTVDSGHLFAAYDAILLDAYGVLVDATGVLPHAQAFVQALVAQNKPFFIVTNDASRLPAAIAARFASLGLPIAAAQIITSVGLLAAHYAAADLRGATTLVLGSADAHTTVQDAGGVPVGPDDLGRGHPAAQLRAIVVCDARGPSLMRDVECAIDAVVAAVDAGRRIDLILCNPDLIYPRSPGHVGLTSGSAMLLITAALSTRLQPAQMPPVARLGKPYAGIFAEAVRRAQSRRLALVGDQLGTDIRGAKDFGIDAILVGTGLTVVRPGEALSPEPDYYLPTLKLPDGR